MISHEMVVRVDAPDRFTATCSCGWVGVRVCDHRTARQNHATHVTEQEEGNQ